MKNMTPLAEQFAELFQGNTRAIGSEDGGCFRINSQDHDLIWTRFVQGHLDGRGEPVGVYPMVYNSPQQKMGSFLDEEWVVRWGCVDFDEGDDESWVHAKNLHLALTTFGITCWLERSRSKGYHVWVFMDEWTDAPLVRYALLAACQLVDAPTKEVNPKQESLAEGQLGNYVRLPYPGWMGDKLLPDSGKRRVMVHPEDRTKLFLCSEFVRLAHESLTGVDALRSVAAHYTAPERPIVRRDWTSQGSELRGDAINRLMGKALVIFEQGPLEGSGRGHTLYKLACYLKEDGRHTVEEAIELIRDADSRWGKFHDRPDGDKRIAELIQKAWYSP